MLLDICFCYWLVWYDLCLLCPFVYSKDDIFVFNLVMYAFCFYILTIAYLYLLRDSSSLSSSYCCLPIGDYYYCSISTILLYAVTNFLCFYNYFLVFCAFFCYCYCYINFIVWTGVLCFGYFLVYFYVYACFIYYLTYYLLFIFSFYYTFYAKLF